MISRRRLLTLMVLLLTASFLLAACERPTPGREDSGDGTTTDVAPEVTDPNVGGGTDSGYPVEQPGEGEAPADDAPPADDSAQPPAAEGGDTAAPPQDDAAPPAAEGGDTADTPPAAGTGDDAAEVGGGSPDAGAGADAGADAGTDVGGGTPDAAADTTGEPAPAASPPTGEISHIVQPRENLYRIGLRYNVSWVTLANYNRITNPNRIDVGQVIRIPAGNTGGEPEPMPTTYVVRPGDNLFRIGLRYGISWIQIAEANGLVNPNQIMVGQTLKIPVSAPGPTPPFTHTVRRGETLFRISLQYGVSWTAVAAANNIQSPHVIYPGQVLQIPGGQ